MTDPATTGIGVTTRMSIGSPSSPSVPGMKP
jgi:hypothetical protein